MVLSKRVVDGDEVHSRLCRDLEKRVRSFLWTPEHPVIFTPRILPAIYGDGRALFAISTLNQRPAYWIIRGCSSWGCGLDCEDAAGIDFVELVDDLVTDLEDAFGRGRCGYSGNSLFLPKKDRLKNCRCEDCMDAPLARWPMVDDAGGCSWSRMNWPKGFPTAPSPLSGMGNLLVEEMSPQPASEG